MMMRFKKALIIADPQIDFCPGGALAVSGADTIIANLNKYMKLFSSQSLPIIVTRDWHPKKTVHFKKYGGNWPAHCMQDTRGAEFHPALKMPKHAIIMSKGTDPAKDGYSAFDSADQNGMSFGNMLKMLGVKELFIGGLATDYCVRATTLEALDAGFKVRVLVDAIKGVDLAPGDSERALREVMASGAVLTDLKNIQSSKK